MTATDHNSSQLERSNYWLTASTCSLDDLVQATSDKTHNNQLTFTKQIIQDVPIFTGDELRYLIADPQNTATLMAELGNIIQHGAGVYVIRNAFEDTQPIDAANSIFRTIIKDEKTSQTKADHFATSGQNDRIWNALEKLCLTKPDVFAQYYANEMIWLASTSWCGPNYQLTSQVNIVHPGGKAQNPHRDYHLGFQENAEAEQYPAHVHQLSPFLTLQGGIAHTDMPIESGPTMLLPFSQRYPAGYLAWRRDDFRRHFDDHFVQFELNKGDAIFFNPALFHGAGGNTTTNVSRSANLLQISSAFGRSLENIDRTAMSNALYPTLQAATKKETLSPSALNRIIASSAEGYPFPTNLDSDPPVDGLAPTSQQTLFEQALTNKLSAEEFAAQLNQLRSRQGHTPKQTNP